MCDAGLRKMAQTPHSLGLAERRDCQGGGWYPSRVGKRARRRVPGDSGAAWKRKLFKWRIIMAVGRQDARLPSQPHNDAPHKVCKLLSLSLLAQKGVGLGSTGVEWSVLGRALLATMRVATVCQAARSRRQLPELTEPQLIIETHLKWHRNQAALMAIHLFNDAVPTKWRLINLVLFLISLLLASPICRERKGRKE